MAAIRSKDTKPEIGLRKGLFARGLRYRKNVRSLPGKPDIVFSRAKLAIFVHGCFWHRHEGCKIASEPKSNTAFWNAKFARNINRDIENSQRLSSLGWHIAVVWECELNSARKLEQQVALITDLVSRSVAKST